MVASPALHIVLFCLVLLLIGWPIVTIADASGDGGTFFYLYGVWASVVVVLFVMSRRLTSEVPERPRELDTAEEEAGSDV